ncbi:site-specific DNA-methyltransferase [Roseicella sp. DB1501]|uniref:site-specific DNA-methyltransferase n=1 Tax=Roseicella sp. DB1501 TaxID=2730925 RepID=UPI001492F9BD|nr:site-specific DNA-methyltransferase [Roseicella sp. DB1501]NOG71279.1 site-specific DNA-methyltransferase [Roseicella sp. DB1501]
MAYEAQQDRFLAALRERGGSAGNGALREALGWADSTYDRVKQALLDAGAILPGRGRGGSVRLADAEAVTPDLPLPSPAAAPRAAAMAQAPRTRTAAAPRAAPAAGPGRPVQSYRHDDATRKNIPTAEFESVMRAEDKTPIQLAYERRSRDLDPQLVWRGKDEQDWSDLIVQAPPLYIQEKVHPQVLIEDLKRQSRQRTQEAPGAMPDLFADFNGLLDSAAATEFYRHDQHWSNRMILGDSLSVMASLAEREGLRGQVQCIYFDPPYGIKFNSNFQWSTTSKDVKDGDRDHVTREPEQVRAFRDTWRDGIHSYLTYLRDRLTVARDLLHESGSIFVQIGDENVHRVRALMDEIFGETNIVSEIVVQKTYGFSSDAISNVSDYVLWYSKKRPSLKSRPLYREKPYELGKGNATWLMAADFSYRGVTAAEREGRAPIPAGAKPYNPDNLISQGRAADPQPFEYRGVGQDPYGRNSHWKPNYPAGMQRLVRSERVHVAENSFRYRRYHSDFSALPYSNIWTDTGTGNFTDEKIYVVQTGAKIVERCLLMATDPGDLVLDPTCGSGTTAYVAEQWGRRWITIDTSRVSLALARSRLMGARYPYYLLADSPEGQRKEAEVTRAPPKTTPTQNRLRQGFVYERLPHITLGDIARNVEIDVIWEQAQTILEPLHATLNQVLGKAWQEWEIPREAGLDWPAKAKEVHAAWWQARIARQKEIDASIAAKADVEYLYDKPYEDRSRTRVAGPFTVESLSPHRTLAVDWDDELIDTLAAAEGRRAAPDRDTAVRDFASMILENLRTAGVQQADKADRISFTSLTGWPGSFIAAEGRFIEGGQERRAGIFIGPEFGTVARPDLVAAAREAGDAGFDLLIACAFAYDAHSAEFDRLGRVRVLKARMNPDLHMARDLKATGAGNLFVVFGEPDIRIDTLPDGMVQVTIEGVDVFKPQTGEVVSEGKEGIALWMIDTDYNEESFFIRHAYFLGANDPYKALKTTLRAEIDEEAWASLNSDVSRPFPKPASGRIAVKVINHLGDEVMKVFSVA